MSKKMLFIGLLAGLVLVGVILVQMQSSTSQNEESNHAKKTGFQLFKSPSATPTKKPALPQRKVLENDYHVFQTYNNCGPAALSMGLSYFDINASQQELGDDLRPYKPTPGNNDDKSVTLEEMGEKAESFGLSFYHRPNGSVAMLEEFIAADIPVITRTWLHPDEDIGHYRVVKGYDRNQGVIIQDDSYEGPNLSYEYQIFNTMWKKFNYEYLVIFPSEKTAEVEQIIGENVDESTAWLNAKKKAEELLSANPDDIYARFNLSIALYHLGLYEESIEEYEQVQSSLPFRTLWYQIEPIDAYFQVGDYERVFEITQDLFENGNRAYAEAYVIRGKSYAAMGVVENAQREYEQALLYNSRLKD